MPQQNARLNTDLDNKLTSSYHDGTDWYMQVKSKDGAIASMGATTDAEASGNGTLIAITKRLRTLLGAGLPSSLANGSLKTAVAEPLPAGNNNIGSVTVTQLPPLPAGTSNIGSVGIASTPADATPGSPHPAKAVMVAGSDGTNACRIRTNSDGTVQVGIVGQVPTVRACQEAVILESATRNASGDTSSSPIDASAYKEAIFFLDVTSVSGANPALDVVIKTKDPASNKWFELVSFSQAAGVTSEMKAASGPLGSHIAAFYTITGDGASFAFSLGAVLKS